MTHNPATPCTAFAQGRKVAKGPLAAVAKMIAENDAVLVFDDATGRVIDIDPRGYRDADLPKRGPGRPKLGVIAREVTLLQRHWDWLAQQPGGASAALRRLVDDARRRDDGATDARAAREAAYRFVHALGGDLPGYEDATRALFAGDLDAFAARLAGWPADTRDYALALARGHDPAP
ncbi:DUF2239 family protein [Pararhodobacter sp.]|uniref:DUF2239 family protein n=1 Tax=Pararhodobacter sp. TaxID=2127056 RepID=UPI002AFE0328|nr:DUF2239 family protein [Pararhodobacter sp.]